MPALVRYAGLMAVLRGGFLVALLTAGAAVSTPAAAQGGRSGEGAPGARREALERRVREQIGREVQERLGLDDAQMRRLGETNQRFEEQRRLLLAEEGTARMGLREQMMRGDSANQQRVGTLLDQMLAVQRKRHDLVEQEQRALAAFLTPVQRATYLVMQDQMRRRMEEMRGRSRRPGARGRPGPPPTP